MNCTRLPESRAQRARVAVDLFGCRGAVRIGSSCPLGFLVVCSSHGRGSTTVSHTHKHTHTHDRYMAKRYRLRGNGLTRGTASCSMGTGGRWGWGLCVGHSFTVDRLHTEMSGVSGLCQPGGPTFDHGGKRVIHSGPHCDDTLPGQIRNRGRVVDAHRQRPIPCVWVGQQDRGIIQLVCIATVWWARM